MKKKNIIIMGIFIVMNMAFVGMTLPMDVKAESNDWENVAVDEKVFPDEKFRTYVEEYIDLNQNKVLEENEIRACQFMNVYQKDIRDLTGIGNFAYLKSLNCGKNELTRLDLTGCDSLTSLDCANNKIQYIQMDYCRDLEMLICSNNQLKELQLQQKEALEYLDCADNQLTELNLAVLDKLHEIYCTNNPIEKLDFSNTPEITSISCGNSQVKFLTLKGCKNLQLLECDNANLQTLDTSECQSLQFLSCNDNHITQLNLGGCDLINTLSCRGNQLKQLEIAQCTSLENLNCGDNQIAGELDFGGFAMLHTADCRDNQLTGLKFNGCVALYQLLCENNQLSSLEVDGCIQLTQLRCNNNRLQELKLQDCGKLNQELEGDVDTAWHVVCDSEVVVTGVDKKYICFEGNQENTPTPIGTITLQPSAVLTPTPVVTKKEETYSITYQLKGGKNNSKNPKKYTEKGCKLYTPKRKGYQFEGWFLDSSFQKKVSQIVSGTRTNITLYAKWSRVTVGKVNVKSAKNTSPQKIKLAYKKVSGAKGYEISYAQNKKFKNAKKVNTAKSTYTIKKLKLKKVYYVKVRAYKYDSCKKKVYGTYSDVKKVIIKK